MSKTHRRSWIDHSTEPQPVEPVEPVTPDDRRVNDPQHEDADSGDQTRR